MTAQIGDSVEAAALARLHDYLRRTGYSLNPSEEMPMDVLAARDAFVQGFKSGARWALLMSGRLASPEFREAIQAICDVVREP